MLTVIKVSLGVALVFLIAGIALAVSKDMENPTYIPPGV
jgi:hypothetical protein